LWEKVGEDGGGKGEWGKRAEGDRVGRGAGVIDAGRR